MLPLNIIITRDEGIICNDLSKNVASFSVHGIFIGSLWFFNLLNIQKYLTSFWSIFTCKMITFCFEHSIFNIHYLSCAH